MTGARIFAMAICCGAPIWAQLTAPGCEALKASDFQTTELFNRRATSGAVGDGTLSEPTRMDVQVVKTAAGAYSHTNIFFVQRKGQVKFYDGLAKQVKVMGTIPTRGVQDNGLMGIALDPNYATNRWIYFWYSPTQMIGQNRQLRLSRITVKADNTLDMATEKILINILGSKTDTWHSGGPMQFDAYGDLWIAIGNNSLDLDPNGCNVMSQTDSTASSEWGPSNTANLRGGFIRIHPDDAATERRQYGSGTYGPGYTIPKGNFGEYWADRFEQQGKSAALVAEYRNPAKVLPEVYVKGERSNYSISVHPTRRWLAWGTVNYAGSNDEFNITKTPIFSGFPYFHANNAKTCPSHNITVAAPMNNSPLNNGVKELPPAIPGAVNNLVNVAIGGPIYTFDSSLNSDVKFPPHFNNTWILGGFGRGGVAGLWVAKLDTTEMKVSGTPQKLDGSILPTTRNFVQGMYGQDGALYILNYDGDYDVATNPGVMRVTYTGTCKVPVSARQAPTPAGNYQSIWVSGQSLVVAERGEHEVTWHGTDGRLLHRASGRDRQEYRLADVQKSLGLPRGVYTVRVKTAQGVFSRSLSLL